nr:PREDICTED: synaptotagmin-like protein 2 isoform X2 [Lepisosteus oculatus]
MIDLSYLTEEEQEMIMTVLKRDAELKRAEEDRIKHLQKTLRDSSRLKYMTGEWFYETKSKRHRDKIHGSDIIRASMRQKKPVTLLELSQSKAEKPSFVNSEKRDIFIPPELSGLIEEPEEEQEEERKSDHPSLETQGDKLKKTATPSVKQRQNPFNSMSDGEETADEREVHLTNGALQPVKTSEGEILPPAKNAIPSVSNLSSENPSVPQGDIKQAPVPKKRTKVFRLQDSFSDSDGPFPKQNGRGDLHSNVSTPRGILKHSPSCSSNDSEMVQNNSNSIIHHLEPAGDGTPNLQGAPPPKVADGMGCIKERMEEFSFNSLDRKQVRFSPAVRQGNHRTASAVEDGRELGEHDLLDLDFMTPSDVEAGSKSEKSNQGNGGGNGPPFSEAFGVGPLEPEDPSLKPRAPETETSLSSLLPANELKTSLPEDTEGPLSEAPGHSASSPRSHTRVNLDWRERDTGEVQSDRELTKRNNRVIEPPQIPVDQHEYHAETYAPQVSNIQSSSNEKGKADNTGVESHAASSNPDTQSYMLTEEEGDSISKVLEWFSRSSESIDRQAPSPSEQVCEQYDEEVEQEPGVHIFATDESGRDRGFMRYRAEDIRSSQSDKRGASDKGLGVEEKVISCKEDIYKVKTPGSGIYSEKSEDKFTPVHYTVHSSLNSGEAFQPKGWMAANEPKKGFEYEGRSLFPDKKVYDLDVISHPHPTSVSRENYIHGGSPVNLSMMDTKDKDSQKESHTEDSPQKVANLKSFWEKGTSGPKILLGKPKADNLKDEKSKLKEADLHSYNESQDFALQAEKDTQALDSGSEVHGKYAVHLEGNEGRTDYIQKRLLSGRTWSASVDAEENKKEISDYVKFHPTISQYEPYRSVMSDSEKEAAFTPSPVEESLPSSESNQKEEEINYTPKSIIFSEEVYTSSAGQNTAADGSPEEEEHKCELISLSKHSTHVCQSSPVPLIRRNLSREDSRSGKISDLKSFWEKEKSGPKIIVGEQKVVSETRASISEVKQPLKASPATTSDLDLKVADVKPSSSSDRKSTSSLSRQKPTFTVLSMKERMQKESGGQSSTNLQFKNLRNFWGGASASQSSPFLIKTQRASPENVAVASPENVAVNLKSPTSPSSNVQETTELFRLKEQSPTEVKKPFMNPNYYPKVLPTEPADVRVRSFGAEKRLVKGFSADITEPKKEMIEKGERSVSPHLLTKPPSSAESVQMKEDLSQCEAVEPQQDRFFSRVLEQSKGFPPQEGVKFHIPPLQSLAPSSVSTEVQSYSAVMGVRSSPEPPRTQGGIMSEKEYRVASQPVLDIHGGNLMSQIKIPPEPLSGTGKEVLGERQYLGEGKILTAKEGIISEKKVGDMPSYCEVQSTPTETEENLRKPNRKMPWLLPHDNTEDIDYEGSSRSSASDTWSFSWASSACNDEDQNPITRALRRSSTRPVSSAKSLEDITALPSKERSKNTSRDELVLSVENVSTVPSTPTSKFSDSEKIKKMSRSVPAFLQQESDGRDTDSTSENSFHIGRQRKIGSSLTNLSNSSGMASMSSVSGSVMSIYSGDFGNVDVTGNIQFAIDYVEQLNELHIFVVQCKDLAAADPKKNRSDPYVKSYLLPDKAKMGKRKTSVKKKTLNPTYNEILRYKISKETLKTQTLNLSVWHNDTFGRNSFLGEVDLDLSKWDWSNTQLNFFPLKPRTPSGLQFTDYRGEMRLALRFLPQISQSKNTPNTGEVHIWVKDCKSLPAIRGTAIDPFVKCSVLPDTSRKSRQKTRVLKKTANPVFNHTMVYDGFRVEDLREACVELTVWDHDRLANHFLGGLRLGLGTGKSYGAVVDWMDSNTDEATLWERMIDSPNEWVEDVLPLRMLMMAKSSWK